MQRQYNVGLNANPGTISLAVDKRRYPRMGPRAPEQAWKTDADILRNRRYLVEATKGGHTPVVHMPILGKMRPPTNMLPPRYSPAYTSDVSHLVV